MLIQKKVHLSKTMSHTLYLLVPRRQSSPTDKNVADLCSGMNGLLLCGGLSCL